MMPGAWSRQPMDREPQRREQRQFGRRQTLWHAWIKVPGRDREPCIVRNFSVAGALLEFEHGPPTAARFTLLIDIFNFTADCYVKHRSATGIGVYFAELTDGTTPRSATSAAEIVDRLQRDQAVKRI
jgi:hypothetical protein